MGIFKRVSHSSLHFILNFLFCQPRIYDQKKKTYLTHKSQLGKDDETLEFPQQGDEKTN